MTKDLVPDDENVLDDSLTETRKHMIDGLDEGRDVIIQKDYAETELKGIDEDKRTATHLISTASIDRDGDIIEVGGWNLKNYKANPVVFLDHDSRVENIIGSGAPKITPDGVVSTTTFAELGKGLLAFHLVASKFARAWSVGFRALKAHWIGDGPDDCEGCGKVRSRNKNHRGVHFVKQELLEYSLVGIPSNQDAVLTLSSKGFSRNEIAVLVGSAAVQHALPRAKAVRVPKVDEATVKRIVSRLRTEVAIIDEL